MVSKVKSTPAEISTADESRGITLLDLAEVLDQHKIWVESGGESGTKADLCGANLMGATLYGAEGLWVGRLGGTNLFDAMLPEAVATFDGAKAIAQATRFSRWIYFLILAACALCAVVIAFTTDVHLVLNSSAIPFSRVSNAVPMSGFYLGAPLFIVLMYLRFHFLLLRLWGNMAALPAVFIDGNTPEKDGPWFLMALVRRHFRWMRDGRSPQAILEAVVAAVLAYWVAPVTLFFFWLRYLARQDMRGTLLHVLLIALAVAAATCLPTVVSRVLRPGDLYRKSKAIVPVVLSTLKVTLLSGCLLVLLSFGVIRGMPADSSVAPDMSDADIRRWAAQGLQFLGYRPYADVTEASFSPLPAHGDWSDEGIAAIRGVRLNQMSLRYARAYHTFWVNARLWRANLEGAYLSEADLRGANLREAQLLRTDLSRADVRDAKLERAVLALANLHDADFSAAKLMGTNLTGAQLNGGVFLDANFKNADLRGAVLTGAVVREASFEGANFDGADLRGAIGLSVEQLCSAKWWRGALLDADIQAAAQARCGASQPAFVGPTKP